MAGVPSDKRVGTPGVGSAYLRIGVLLLGILNYQLGGIVPYVFVNTISCRDSLICYLSKHIKAMPKTDFKKCA